MNAVSWKEVVPQIIHKYEKSPMYEYQLEACSKL